MAYINGTCSYSVEITIGFTSSPSVFSSASRLVTEDPQSGTADAPTTFWARAGPLLYHGHGKQFVIASDETFQLGVGTTQNPFKGKLVLQYYVSSSDFVRLEARTTLGYGIILDDSHQDVGELKGKALRPVVRVRHRYSDTASLYISANFGQYCFAFDSGFRSMTEHYFATRRRNFLDSARLLPSEIIIIIAAFAADAARDLEQACHGLLDVGMDMPPYHVRAYPHRKRNSASQIVRYI
ncbi:uncharacterized protein PHACADRAFT_29193 [Phanerochaete carnosa HHB-10118-sp]|uniref:Uncharacterized protein n=1 Tax=Phanerochaete carnosa (strain HHB-10118-sp) TaxID=650164 RepID=K5W4M3_PHACS|nr:uncharacterized protein PHACADRAFT_29193 [Phanerochaete carnosa HHB-10118-sp]EKM53889.1 hypothetical protein PHACADRAFT_29193 [Phanerochaete carnosa HHB-10118-sp]